MTASISQGIIQIESESSRLVLASSNGEIVQEESDKTKPEQRWQVVDAGKQGYYYIKHPDSDGGHVITAKGSTDRLTALKNPTDGESQWRLEPWDEYVYLINGRFTGEAVSVYPGDNHIGLYRNMHESNQRWRLVTTSTAPKLPTTPQLIMHTISTLQITPMGHQMGDVEVRLYRDGLWPPPKARQWEFLPGGQDRLVRIRNASYNSDAEQKYLTLPENKTIVHQFGRMSEGNRQLWRLVQVNPGQADFLIASAVNEELVISPKLNGLANETPLEVAAVGPWTDQFWRWYPPRSE